MNVLIVSGSIMAAARVSMPGATDSNLEFADYSLYSNLSDDELMQLAIERSIADAQNSGPGTENSKSPVVLNRPAGPRRAPPSHRPQQQTEPAACPANPPRYSLMGFIQTEMRYSTCLFSNLNSKELEPIVKAISEGDVGSVRLLVKQPGCSLLKPNKDGWIPLHEAAYYGQDQCIKIILRAQPGMINQRTLKEQTALMIAVTREHLACVERLLEKGADPDIANKERETPLYKGNIVLVSIHLSIYLSIYLSSLKFKILDYQPRATAFFFSALHLIWPSVVLWKILAFLYISVACEKENPAMVAMLLNYGASVNMSCIQGWTALHESVCRNNVEICEMLIKAGAKVSMPNMYGITPIFVAAQKSNSNLTFKSILVYTSKITLKNTQLLIFSIISMLIPATSKARVRRTGISPLHLAAERNRNDIVEFLIEADFDVNAMLSEDRSMMYEDRRSTALYFAVMNNNIDATTMLLKAGANPNLDTFNPLLVALRQGCIQTVTLLVEHGANVNAYIPTHPTTFPASVMFCMKYLTILKYLMDNGCDALSCFNCVYGSNLHPPIKTRRNQRYDPDEVVEKTCVQFCEVISTENYSRWAGPIIDVLLDYVGHVKLCARLTEHLDSYHEWQCIKEKATPPRPLMQLCRLKIRNLLGIKRLKKIHRLPVPPRLIKFLNHQEREQDF
uniref:Ankyrin repeat and SOCS box protein 2-like n=1 Tax=Sinocyclocheilus rhinocerous TaxID=307959 RepID=A0A673NB13_9TELE